MKLVTVFCPLTTTGAGEFVAQTGERRFVVDCKVKPVKLVGHVRTTYCLAALAFNRGIYDKAEHRAIAKTSALKSCSVENVARQNHRS